MPIYEYTCPACGAQFEELVFGEDAPECPKCGGKECERLISVSRGSANSKGGTGLPADLSGAMSGGLGGPGGCGGGGFS